LRAGACRPRGVGLQRVLGSEGGCFTRNKKLRASLTRSRHAQEICVCAGNFLCLSNAGYGFSVGSDLGFVWRPAPLSLKMAENTFKMCVAESYVSPDVNSLRTSCAQKNNSIIIAQLDRSLYPSLPHSHLPPSALAPPRALSSSRQFMRRFSAFLEYAISIKGDEPRTWLDQLLLHFVRQSLLSRFCTLGVGNKLGQTPNPSGAARFLPCCLAPSFAPSSPPALSGLRRMRRIRRCHASPCVEELGGRAVRRPCLPCTFAILWGAADR
jgi:hypothetical protein